MLSFLIYLIILGIGYRPQAKLYLLFSRVIFYCNRRNRMQNGTLLHLAILRKISRNNPTINYRQRYNSIKRKQLYANLTEQNVQDKPWPLVELNPNRQKRRALDSRDKIRRKMENMTISGWSTKSIDFAQQKGEQDGRSNLCQNKSEKQTKKNKLFRRRHLSEANNIKVKVPLPFSNENFIPDYEFKKKYKTPAVFKPQYYPLKQASINYRPQASTIEKDVVQASDFLTQKLPSFDAFIAEMKQRAKNKKIKL